MVVHRAVRGFLSLGILISALLTGIVPPAVGERSDRRVDRVMYALPQVAAPVVRTDLEGELVRLLNEERVAAGLVPFTSSGTLRAAARQHAAEMFQRGYFSHMSQDGRTPLARALQAGATGHLFGENLAYARDVREAHRLLMASPGHRQNILQGSFRQVGVGVVDGGNAGLVVVENFSD